MTETPTVGSFVTTGTISTADVAGAVNAYPPDPGTKAYPLGEQFVLDLAAAVAAHPFAVRMLSHGGAGIAAHRAAVRTAIMQARPKRQ
jgi:hypothetical protein